MELAMTSLSQFSTLLGTLPPPSLALLMEELVSRGLPGNWHAACCWCTKPLREEEEVSGGEEGGGKGVEENQKTPSQTHQVDWEEDDGLMSLPSFSSDDFMDMHVV
ncbi:hypothetical protein GBAR_LOCUS4203 [Geodia barretti]|uniref:Uncharacterized protein n=1 Tax=Geodia barretti TaxID=519541 RepID=A0AA35W853_GEOBA|nr:hypothetical protein GBAR_LOCUS4203 [Geodia barretti]